jgi:hypothetical protein
MTNHEKFLERQAKIFGKADTMQAAERLHLASRQRESEYTESTTGRTVKLKPPVADTLLKRGEVKYLSKTMAVPYFPFFDKAGN